MRPWAPFPTCPGHGWSSLLGQAALPQSPHPASRLRPTSCLISKSPLNSALSLGEQKPQHRAAVRGRLPPGLGLLPALVESMVPSNHLILCHPLLLSSVFPSDLALCIRWPNIGSFSFSISPSNEYSGLISFRIDWFDLHAVQGTLRCLLQDHSSKASVLSCSAFFMVQPPRNERKIHFRHFQLQAPTYNTHQLLLLSSLHLLSQQHRVFNL